MANAADFSEEGVLALRDLRALRGRVTQSLDGIDALVAEASMGQAALLADVRVSLEQANRMTASIEQQVVRLAPVYEQVGLQTEAAMDGVSRLTRRADVPFRSQSKTNCELAWHISARC